MTPLHWTAHHGGHVTTRALLDRAGVDLEVRDNLGRTALSVACDLSAIGYSSGPDSDIKHEKVLHLLLQHGADITAKDFMGRTASDTVAPFAKRCAALLRKYYGISLS